MSDTSRQVIRRLMTRSALTPSEYQTLDRDLTRLEVLTDEDRRSARDLIRMIEEIRSVAGDMRCAVALTLALHSDMAADTPGRQAMLQLLGLAPGDAAPTERPRPVAVAGGG